jgi:hypothetical protein
MQSRVPSDDRHTKISLRIFSACLAILDSVTAAFLVRYSLRAPSTIRQIEVHLFLAGKMPRPCRPHPSNARLDIEANEAPIPLDTVMEEPKDPFAIWIPYRVSCWLRP